MVRSEEQARKKIRTLRKATSTTFTVALHMHLVVDVDEAAENDRLRLSPQLS